MSLVCISAGLHLGCTAGGTVSPVPPSPPPPPPIPVASVRIEPSSFSVIAGSTRQLYATPRDAQGNWLARSVTWTSSDQGIATVSSSGLLTGISAGVAQINATSEGQTGEATATITPNPWRTTGSLVIGRGLPTATLLADGKVLVAGGLGAGSQFESELYDPGTGRWTLTGNMGTARVNHTAVRLTNGKVLVAGGYADGALPYPDALASTEIYDPATGNWSPTGSMLSARAGHIAALLPDGTVLVAGGRSRGGTDLNPLASSEIYDPAAGTWAAAGQMNAYRAGGLDFGGLTSLVLSNGKVLVAGGIGGTFASPQLVPPAETFDPGTRAWSAAGTLITPRTDLQIVLLSDGRALVVGGFQGELVDDDSHGSHGPFFWVEPLNSAELYDPQTNQWSATRNMYWARAGHTATVLPNGLVLVAGGSGLVLDPGGHGYYRGPLRSAEIYDPTTGTWSATGDLAAERAYHVAVRLTNGKVLVIGGGAGSDPNKVEVFDPAIAFATAQVGPRR